MLFVYTWQGYYRIESSFDVQYTKKLKRRFDFLLLSEKTHSQNLWRFEMNGCWSEQMKFVQREDTIIMQAYKLEIDMQYFFFYKFAIRSFSNFRIQNLKVKYG